MRIFIIFLFKLGVVTDSNCGNKSSVSTQAGPTDFSSVTTQTEADFSSVATQTEADFGSVATQTEAIPTDFSSVATQTDADAFEQVLSEKSLEMDSKKLKFYTG